MITNKDPSKLTDEEIQAELDSISVSAKQQSESISKQAVNVAGTVLKPAIMASNVADYFVGAPIRAAAIEGLKEYNKPESTATSVTAATLSGPMYSALRDPTKYDPRYNYAELARQVGVTDKPMSEFAPEEAKPYVPDVPINQAVGLGAEVALDPFNVAGRSMKPLGTMLKEKSLANTEHALVRMSDAGKAKTSDWLNADKLKSVAQTMRDEKLVSSITNPKKLYNELNGETALVPHPEFPGKMKQEVVKPGKIQEIGSKRGQAVDIMDSTGLTFKKKEAADLISNAIIAENQTSVSLTGLGEASKIRKKVYNMLNVGTGSDKISIKEAVQIKTDLQKEVYRLKNSERYGHEVGTNKHIYETAEQGVTEVLNRLAIDPRIPKQAGLDYLKYNQKYSDLTVLNEIVKNAKLNNYKESSGVLGSLVSAGVGGAVGAASGINPAISAGLYTAAKGAGSSAMGQTPAWTARLQGMNIPGLSPQATERALNYVQRPISIVRGLQGDQGRSPQSIPNLPMQLTKFQIPRSSKWILASKENTDIVLAKIAQSTLGMQDQEASKVVALFGTLLTEHPEKLSMALPAIVLALPDMFEPDDYNRIDNKILDPMLKAKAAKDLQNNKILTVREKAAKAKMLAEEGILDK